jgi:hypothetical protein
MLLNTATKVYAGSTPATAVYLGATKVWPPAAADWTVVDIGAPKFALNGHDIHEGSARPPHLTSNRAPVLYITDGNGLVIRYETEGEFFHASGPPTPATAELQVWLNDISHVVAREIVQTSSTSLAIEFAITPDAIVGVAQSALLVHVPGAGTISDGWYWWGTKARWLVRAL